MAYESFLDVNPNVAYRKALMELQPQMSRYFEPRYQDVYEEYQAVLPQNPALTFSSFLNTYPFMQTFGGVSPRLKGEYQNIYSPNARWLSY